MTVNVAAGGSGGGGSFTGFSTTSTDQVVYVSKTGSDSGVGTILSPYLTISKALSVASDGQTIKVGAGTFQENCRVLNLIRLEGTGGPGNGGTGTIIQAPSVAANCVDIGSAQNPLYGVELADFCFQAFNSSWTGIGIRGMASQVRVDNVFAVNPASAPAKGVGGIGYALGHGEDWTVIGYRTSGLAQGLVLGVEATDHTFVAGAFSNNYQDRYNGPYEVFRTPLSSGITSGATTIPLTYGADLVAGPGLAIIDSEGIAYATNSANQLTGVTRAVVGWLTGAITNSQTTGITLTVLSQGDPATNQATTIPSSGTVLIGSEKVSYTSLTNNGDGTYTLGGTVTRGASATTAVSHSANAFASDVAGTSAASHSAGAFVIQSFGTLVGGAPLAGAIGGGSAFLTYKAVSCVAQGGGDYVDEWFGGGYVFIRNEFDESSNTNTVKFHTTAIGNEHVLTAFAPQTAVIDDGRQNVYRSPQGASSFTLSNLSSLCRVENNQGVAITNNGTNNVIAAFDQTLAMDSGAAPSVDHSTALLDQRVWYYDLASGTVKGMAISQAYVANGTATLSTGSVTISNASITSSAIVKAWNIGGAGTEGALYVTLSAGTGFTIHSTSGSDTSKVYYEVVSY